MNISSIDTLNTYQCNVLHNILLNIDVVWKSLYQTNYIKKELIQDKWYCFKLSKSSDFTETPIDIEVFIFDIDKNVEFHISTRMDHMSTDGLNFIFHRSEIQLIKTINREIDSLNSKKNMIWEGLKDAGTLPYC